ncbi:cullin family protein [Necator americanus]|nr:cullin family protein [Necator americanus]ETN72029.1 cullin family protein [Necator americanus]
MAVVNFPKSYPTLSTLRNCMINVREYGREKLVNTLIDDIESQLLHIAVDTPTILNGYSLCVESLRELDPSCVIMHRVCKVIKEYLKRRPDTVRQIINYITSEKRDDLAAHLANRCGTIVDEDELTGANDDFLPEAMNLSQWRHWTPDPIDATPGESGRFRQAADVFNMLVSVYGSKEMFVKEYRQLLAERLTSSNTKDPIFERRYLDLLKLRFNEGELQQCEVMLKDIRDSQRIDRTALGRKCIPVSACVISSHFWPKIVSETVSEFPQALEEALTEYEKSFMDHKESRKLQWMRAVGCVEVTLKLGDVEIDKVVPNPTAAVLYLYLEKESWTVAEVAERLSISKGVARRRLEWWRTQGLLAQNLPTGATAEEWSLVTNPSLLATSRGAADDESDEDEGAIEETADAIDALEQYWSYTKNFIANHDNGEVKAERMHRIYRMFSSPSAQGPSLETVTAFLMRKVKMNLLTYNNGFFRVVKENTTKGNER